MILSLGTSKFKISWGVLEAMIDFLKIVVFKELKIFCLYTKCFIFFINILDMDKIVCWKIYN